MSVHEEGQPVFPEYQHPSNDNMRMAHPKQVGPLMKMVKHIMKLPKKKVLQRRNKASRKKFRIL